MTFGEKVQRLRKEKGLYQQQLAEMAGVSVRTISNYEISGVYPRTMAIAQNLAKALDTTTTYLLDDVEIYSIEALEKGGKKSENAVESLLINVSAFFAGGDISDDDKDKVMKAINEIYWDTKEKNKEKYTPSKYKK